MKIKKFTLLQLFSLIDGRLSTTMDDVYDMLNHIMNTSLMTHHLGTANKYLKMKNPEWFHKAAALITEMEQECPIKERNMEQFAWMMGYFLKKGNPTIDVPQLITTGEEEKEFGEYMIKNSLLLNR